MPDTWCPLAVLRLKAIRNAGRELTEEEEAKLPGCPWAIDHQLANYCFFKYVSEYSGDKAPSDVEIAALLNVSIDTVKKLEKNGLSKIREDEVFKTIKEEHSGEAIIQDRDSDSFNIVK
jgi:hypothetical protein